MLGDDEARADFEKRYGRDPRSIGGLLGARCSAAGSSRPANGKMPG